MPQTSLYAYGILEWHVEQWSFKIFQKHPKYLTLWAQQPAPASSNNRSKRWRAYIIATKEIGKLGAKDLTLRYTFDAGTPGTINYTCPNLGYGGLQDYTRHMFIVYAKPVRGHGSGWNKPLAWREFQTGRHPDGTPSVDSPYRLRDRRWRTGEIEAGLCQRFAAATAA